MKIVAVMPVHGRLPLLRLTVARLVRQGIDVVCAGHTDEEQEICTEAGAYFILCDARLTLGAKWQLCVDMARKMKPDALMMMGSADMVQDGWAETLYADLQKGYAMAGTESIYFLDIQPKNSKRMFHWGGYLGHRKGEPIGTGRMVSRRALDLIGWKLFDTKLNIGMDGSMLSSVSRVKDQFKGLVFNHPSLKCLSVSTYRWENLHSFERESRLPQSKFCDPDKIIRAYFPEMENLFGEDTTGPVIIPYTVNVGEYDAPRSDIKCFTDYDRFSNNERNSRIYFILPHKFMQCDISILVSCEVTVKIPYEQLVEEWLGDADIALFKHPWRDCVHEEIKAAECRMKRIDELKILQAQGEHYRSIGIPEHMGNLPETAIIIRRHTPKVNRFCEAWWAEMCRWSYRDQCSFSVVLREFPDIKVNFIEPDVRVHSYTEIGNHLK
jgi:hypothetical protein